MEDFIQDIDIDWRPLLIRELMAVEIGHRKKLEQSFSEADLFAIYSNLEPELRNQLAYLQGGSGDACDEKTLRHPSKTPPDFNATKELESKPSGSSRGLHIRCPHCSNPVELLSDTPYESITCRTCGSAFNLVDPATQTIEAPALQKLGRFELLARLGVGGFGTVWKARDTELNRSVAVKIPRKGQLDRGEAEQFLREARMVARLRHNSIVPVHEVGREGDTIFIVTDFIRGVSLSDWLSGKTPSTRTITKLTITIADALHHAHEQGVIHRDLKPSNILMDEQENAFLTDFGLAKRDVGEITMTVEGQVLGTPAYMSPEQARGQSSWVDRRSDIYSLGVVLFRMLTGELPFRGNAQMQIHQRLTQDPPDPRSLNRFIPHDLATVCLKCLETDPNKRFSTAAEVGSELSRFLRGEPILSRPISKTERALRWAKRKPAVAAVAALTLFLAVAGPITAASIYYLKARQAELIVKENNAIKALNAQAGQSAQQLKELTGKLNVLEGQSDPGEFWPPRPNSSPFQNMARDFYTYVINSGSTTHAKNDLKEDNVRATLATAMLAEAAGQTVEAIQNYELARDELLALKQKNSTRPEISLALADTFNSLGRLNEKSNRNTAAENYRKVVEILQPLVNQHPSEPRYKAALLDAEVESNMYANASSNENKLLEFDELSRSLANLWPKDPQAIYRLACFLTAREPVLETPQTSPPSSNSPSTSK